MIFTDEGMMRSERLNHKHLLRGYCVKNTQKNLKIYIEGKPQVTSEK